MTFMFFTHSTNGWKRLFHAGLWAGYSEKHFIKVNKIWSCFSLLYATMSLQQKIYIFPIFASVRSRRIRLDTKLVREQKKKRDQGPLGKGPHQPFASSSHGVFSVEINKSEKKEDNLQVHWNEGKSTPCQEDVLVGILLIDIRTFFLEIFLILHMTHLEVYLYLIS